MDERSHRELGAIVSGNGTVSFSIWAPLASEVKLILESPAGDHQLEGMTRDSAGIWQCQIAAAQGQRYGFVIDGAAQVPDPCSRSQPGGLHSLSEIVDPAEFRWTDAAWRRPAFSELVIYEMHIGCHAPGGTFAGAATLLSHLRELGVNAIEIMPIAEFPGRWNWGYDGASLFAPFHGYGGPAGLHGLVDAAHAAGIAVILDVVYNHYGPDGNYLAQLAPDILKETDQTPWGAAINFDGPNSQLVRNIYLQHTTQFVRDYHIDGLRFDAADEIHDGSDRHILADISDAIAALPSLGERPYLIAETRAFDPQFLRPTGDGGFGFDGLWTDEFHHSCQVILQDDHEGYYAGFGAGSGALAATIRHGWLPGWLGQPAPAEAGPPYAWGSFIYSLQNHDQIGNRAFGERPSTTANEGAIRAATMLLLLLPQTPLLFAGQEWFTTTPFRYFTDHNDALGTAVSVGRREEFKDFHAFEDPDLRQQIPDPQALESYEASRLNYAEARAGRSRLAFTYHQELIRLRRADRVLQSFRAAPSPMNVESDGTLIAVRFECESGQRLLVVNLSDQGRNVALPECTATPLLTSDEGRFGGFGRDLTQQQGELRIPARMAAFLAIDQTT